MRAFAKLRGCLLATASLHTPIVGPAAAQTYNWSGFYVGLNAGAARGSSDATTSVTCPPISSPGISGYICSSSFPPSNVNAASVVANGSGSASSTGFTGGVQAGYNWQTSGVVYGLEMDFGALSLSGSRTASADYPNPGGLGFFSGTPRYTVGTSFDTDWLMTARGRLGWATGNLMMYATGGLAMTKLHISNTFSDVNAATAGAFGGSSASDLRIGWTLGGGAELALDKNWTLKAEYLYVDFGSVTTNSTVVVRGATGYTNGLYTSADLNAHIGRVGVNYKF